MGSWTVDTSRWPIVVHHVEGTPSNDELDQWIEAATRILDRKERHVAVLDATRISGFSAYVRSRATSWQRDHASALRTHCMGTAFVLSSPLLRFVAMTVVLITRLPTPLRIFDNVDEAVKWGEQRMAEVKLDDESSKRLRGA